ncbi:hypothetical protein GCK32_000115 [Trichostrongylus colubriformis]|uniref:Beta-lactamase-related domain-containing protein n=1 Tax=Trichostrongylus colubriformis TaxID=6319 RepID=A0AAN8J2G1_TRICO
MISATVTPFFQIDLTRPDEQLNRLGSLQIVHPPPPNEQDWVLTSGNESLVDNVLSISLKFGGRLVSMGYFVRQHQVIYYAIMHKYAGPVFIKPSPMTYDELMIALKENRKRDLVLTQICGQEEKGRTTFTTYWERIPSTDYEAQLMAAGRGIHLIIGRAALCGPSTPFLCEAEGMARTLFENFHPMAFRGTRRRLEVCPIPLYELPFRYVGVWQTRRSDPVHYEAHYGLTLDACMLRNKLLTAKGYIATSLTVFNNKNQVLCTAIWEQQEGRKSFIVIDHDLKRMYSKFHGNLKCIPRQISHFVDKLGAVNYVVLWSDFHSNRYPDVEPLWSKREIPVRFLQGSPELLSESQLDFLIERVEHFMRDLNIPGLSLAISKREQLKFAAGGWDNLQSDAAWIQPHLNTEELITYVLENVPLENVPGTKWIYSNFGYQLLGYLVEHLSGMTYESFVKKSIFAPAGVHDIRVAGPRISDRAPREVLYYMSGNNLGFDPYEMLASERIGPWGGWIASPIQLLLFMSRVDGFPHRRDLLSTKSIIQCSTPSSPSNSTYGLGWSLNIMGFNGWQHDGRMPGSAAMLVRLDNGLELAITVNKEYSERDFFHELGYVLHHIGNNHDWWNDDKDLFYHLHK